MHITASPTSYTRTKRRSAAFTLVELMVSAGVSAMILAGVLSTFVIMGRAGANLQNYSDIETGARKALELFSRDVRLAWKVNSFGANAVTLSIPDNTADNPSDSTLATPPGADTTKGAYTVTYTFDTAGKKLTRQVAGAATATVLLTGVEQITGKNPFNYYRVYTTAYQDGFNTSNVVTAGHTGEIKQVEINFLVKQKSTTISAASNKVLSARFIIRNL
jgi:Tfp pilus assembly protein PilW